MCGRYGFSMLLKHFQGFHPVFMYRLSGNPKFECQFLIGISIIVVTYYNNPLIRREKTK